MSKTFHGGFADLKYIPRRARHVYHGEGQRHDRCLVELYKLYFQLVKYEGSKVDAFYLRPNMKYLSFSNSPVGVNTLSDILPDMCRAVGIKVKTSHSLRVTCATVLFQHGVGEKLIRDRTGHRSNALFKYEKANKEQISNVSRILGSSTSVENVEENSVEDVNVSSTSVTEECVANAINLRSPYCVNCNVNFFVKKV